MDKLNTLIKEHKPGFSLPQAFYTDEEIYQLDLERVWHRHWLFAGHVSRIPNTGDYFLFEMDRESLIIIRDKNETIHAHFNVCRHRGSAVCLKEAGNAQQLVCPYHHWSYNHDGSLHAARMMSEDFDRSAYGLEHAHVQILEGLIFVSLAKDPPDFQPFLDDAGPHLKHQGIADAKICYSERIELKANWKLATENFMECGHCALAHPQYAQIHGIKRRMSKEDEDAYNAYVKKQQEKVAACGFNEVSKSFTRERWYHFSHFCLQPGFETQSLDGKPVAPLMGMHKEYGGVMNTLTYPFFFLEAGADVFVTFSVTPKSPTVSIIEAHWYVDRNAEEGKDYCIERVIGAWKTTGDQDWVLTENNQKGVNSIAYQPGPYSASQEGLCKIFLEWYLDQISVKAYKDSGHSSEAN